MSKTTGSLRIIKTEMFKDLFLKKGSKFELLIYSFRCPCALSETEHMYVQAT